jgi:hypothetical protein
MFILERACEKNTMAELNTQVDSDSVLSNIYTKDFTQGFGL